MSTSIISLIEFQIALHRAIDAMYYQHGVVPIVQVNRLYMKLFFEREPSPHHIISTAIISLIEFELKLNINDITLL